jgi:hypothetical protein
MSDEVVSHCCMDRNCIASENCPGYDYCIYFNTPDSISIGDHIKFIIGGNESVVVTDVEKDGVGYYDPSDGSTGWAGMFTFFRSK